jgi:hypothetical protein
MKERADFVFDCVARGARLFEPHARNFYARALTTAAKKSTQSIFVCGSFYERG